MIPASCPSTTLQDQKVPVPLESVLRLAGQFLDSGQLDEAERLLDHILSAAPDTASALNLKAVLLYRTNRSETAVELARQIAQEFEASAYGSSRNRRTGRIASAAGRFRSRQVVVPGAMGVAGE